MSWFQAAICLSQAQSGQGWRPSAWAGSLRGWAATAVIGFLFSMFCSLCKRFQWTPCYVPTYNKYI